ncbi:FIST signal transduction protein [Zunongwangia sp.]|uniref:FIST signal transduction protein n=1 Tax=Zunongwangia sp. TaxID=1965325 RepID=UPI003AA7D3B5
MKITQAIKKDALPWQYNGEDKKLHTNPLVLIFGERMLLQDETIINEIREEFPYENLIFATSAGEIHNTTVQENSIIVNIISFEKATFNIQTANILDFEKDSTAIGQHLIQKLDPENLKHIFLISEGTFCNASQLLAGLEKYNVSKAPISGGLCGDDHRFEKTLASLNQNPQEGEVILIGLYGESLEVSYASHGGWIPFGPMRNVTKSKGNILIELDGIPALDLYKKYLGEKAKDLPHSALFYPLHITEKGKDHSVVRTILNIDHENKTMIFAGDIEEGAQAQLMLATVDGIVNGASIAAQKGLNNRKKAPELAILVSCIGRKLVLNQRVEEEIEEINIKLENHTPIIGFYSYGEITPSPETSESILHNQTMTLTLISE